MIELVQDRRAIGVETPLGKDKLALTAFTGEERLSGLFNFDLHLISDEASIKPDEIVGKQIDFYVLFPDEEKRYFNGFVSRFVYSGKNDRVHMYRAQVVPWLWFLTKGTDCRVHETDGQQSAQDIIDALLGELGFSDFRWDLKRTPEKRDYCVQYRETHFEFVTRLLAEEGIFYYFTHEQGKHELVMSDHVDGVFDCKDSEVRLLSNMAQPESTDNLRGWNHEYQFTTGKYAHTDFDFENPTTSLLVKKSSLVSLPENTKYEYYDFPGLYFDKGLGDTLAQLRMEEEEANHNTVSGGSDCRSFSPGGRFEITEHHNDGEKGGKWVLTAVQHSAQQGGSYQVGAAHSNEIYRNSFRCLPADVVFRPGFRAKPRIYGIQSAEIVGPAGEEIYTDEHGRVKVQFPWDRLGAKDEKSSNWIRVSQVHAGAGWGMMDIPRIGEEVIVSFVEGDPDRPLVVGRVYNGQNAAPWALPGEKTRRGNTTSTHKGGGYNELSMDDTAGKEELRINAQFDMNSNVNNNQTLNVGVDRTNTIGNDEKITIGNDSIIEIGNNQEISIGANQEVSIGANQEVSITDNQEVQIGANQEVTIGANQEVNIDSNQEIAVGSNIEVSAGSKIEISAGTSIELIVGGNSIKLEQSGITINGVKVAIEGQAEASMKAPITKINADGMLTLMGAMTKIN
ncbi:MAG: type VI secretion system tip protein TssI/VgrG [Fuerstiella sp.]